MLTIEHLNTGYEKKQVLHNVSLKIEKDDLALLIGSNGSGKSTLLKSIYGICKVWEGKIFFEGENITNAKPKELLKKGILYIPQKNNLFEQLTVKENLEISGMALQNNTFFKQRLEFVNTNFPILAKHHKTHPMKMSGGERQQLVLAMAFLHQPKLLLIDEPYTGLAPQSVYQINKELQKLNKDFGVTILMVEHRIKEALQISNHLIALKLGKTVEDSKEVANFALSDFNKILI